MVTNPKGKTEKLCDVYIYILGENLIPEKFKNLGKLGIKVMGWFNDASLYGQFKTAFIDTDLDMIYLDPHHLYSLYQKDYPMESNASAYYPPEINFSSEADMADSGFHWEQGDYVFLLIRRAEGLWYIKGGIYQG